MSRRLKTLSTPRTMHPTDRVEALRHLLDTVYADDGVCQVNRVHCEISVNYRRLLYAISMTWPDLLRARQADFSRVRARKCNFRGAMMSAKMVSADL